MQVDERALQSSLRRLREAAFDADVVAVLERAVGAVHRVFGCAGAGVMFVTEDGRLSYVAASDEAGRLLEDAQARAGQGPCYDSYVYAREVISGDVRTDDRWPRLAAHLPGKIRAVAGIPVALGGSPVGTLNVYRDEPASWDEEDLRALHAYGDLIAEIVGAALAAHDHSALAAQLQYALDYRVIIERAVGYLMGARGLDAVTAFNVMRKRARDSRRKVADVAADVLAGTGAGVDEEDRSGN
ncbi:MAG TPA: GAF and ANTAR domain-containing protein [Streptosporangiaceae bacterium]|nr:GAF and ANTAR domain-containing protein [Streptosporangiaceae bacterium]